MELLTALLVCASFADAVTASEILEITVGQTYWVENTFPIQQTIQGPVLARIIEVRANSSVIIPPAVEVLRTSPDLKVRYALRGRTTSSHAARVRFALEVRDAEGVVARRRINHQVVVLPATFRLEDIEAAHQALKIHQEEAERAYAALSAIHDILPASGLARPPPRNRIPDPLVPEVERFVVARLRANSAAFTLRIAADARDPAVSERAIFALAEPSRRSKAQQRAGTQIIENLDVAGVLALAHQTLDGLAFDRTEGILQALRQSGRPLRPELAETLALLGVLHHLRGNRNLAIVNLDSAFCLKPTLEIHLQRAALNVPLEAARQRAACNGHGLSVHSVVARQDQTSEGPVFVVEARFGPDPHRIATTGTVELWGFGGAMFFAENARTVHDPEGILKLNLRSPQGAVSDDGRILVKVFVKDSSGVILASAGDPDPMSLAVGEEHSDGGIPTWLWITAGALALVGGATAVGVWAVNQNPEPVRGVGPIDIRF